MLNSKNIEMEPRSILSLRIISWFSLFWVLVPSIGIPYIQISRELNLWDYAGIPLIFIFYTFVYFTLLKQPASYDLHSDIFLYGFQSKDYLYKKEPYGTINFSKIAKVEKITDKIGSTELIRVYEGNRIHYLGDEKVTDAFLFEIKDRGMDDLIRTDERELSWLKKRLLKTKGGKMEVKKG